MLMCWGVRLGVHRKVEGCWDQQAMITVEAAAQGLGRAHRSLDGEGSQCPHKCWKQCLWCPEAAELQG